MRQQDFILALGWEVGGRLKSVTRDELLAALRAVGAITHEIGQRLCPRCQTIQPGWPDQWKNCAVAPGVIYVCASCAEATR